MRSYTLILSVGLVLLSGVICSRVYADDTDGYLPPPHTFGRAVSDGKMPLIKKMLAQNPSLANKPLNADWSPLSYAARFGTVEVVRYLLAKGAKVNAKTRYMSPLCAAVAGGRMAIIQMLVAKGADVKEDWLLYYAINKTAIFHYLVEQGANIHIHLGKNEQSLLLNMVISENPDIDDARLLLEKGADVNEGARGVPLLWCVMHTKAVPTKKYIDMVKLLLGKGADPNLMGQSNTDASEHRTALSEAVINKNSAMVRLLMTYESPVRCTEATINAARKDLQYSVLTKNDLLQKDLAALQEIAQLLKEPLTVLPDGSSDVPSNVTFLFKVSASGWSSANFDGGQGSINTTPEGETLISTTKLGANRWSNQASIVSSEIKDDETYIVKFSAKADKPVQVRVVAEQNQEPYQSIGLEPKELRLNSEYRPYEFKFTARNATGKSTKTLSFQFGGAKGTPGVVFVKDASIEHVVVKRITQ